MTRLYAVGGRQKKGVTDRTEEWHHYEAGVVAAVDADTGRIESCTEYVSPPEACAENDPSITFKTATLEGGKLFVPTQTEILVYDLPAFTCSRYVSIPYFNDVHHVRPGANGTLLVANTGLDMVVEVGADGAVCREWSAIDEDPWIRFSRDIDYRKVVTTKPHRAHPNHVFTMDGEIWVTRCNHHDIRCLTADLNHIVIGETYIHDGVAYGDGVYFTVVRGEIVIVDRGERVVRRRVDLNKIVGDGPPLGWCRGIELLDDRHAVVGFSRLRPTKWEQNLRWVKRQLGGKGTGLLPTRIALVDLSAERFVWEVDLEPGGLNAVFSIHLAG